MKKFALASITEHHSSLGTHLKVVQTSEIIHILGDRISALHLIKLGVDHHQHLREEQI